MRFEKDDLTEERYNLERENRTLSSYFVLLSHQRGFEE